MNHPKNASLSAAAWVEGCYDTVKFRNIPDTYRMPKLQRKLAAMSKADYEKLAQFRYQLRRFLRLSEELTHRKGITVLQYLLLLQVKGFPGREWATVGELTERLQAKQHGVVSLISRCEEAGLVKRVASKSDRRRVEIHLTAKGSRCLEQLAQSHRDELTSLRSHLVAWEHENINPGAVTATEAPRKRR